MPKGSSPANPRDIAWAKPQDRRRLLPTYAELQNYPFQPNKTPSQSSPAPLQTKRNDEPCHDNAIDPSVADLLPLLRSQPPHFTKLHIHGKSYLITQGDTVRLPFRMKDVEVGDILRLNRAIVIGSRDYTLKAGTSLTGEKPRYLDDRLYTCRARVVGVTTEPLRVKLKTKRRRRHVKRTLSKETYTVLKIMELTVNPAPE